jgi:hypothetical protein
VLALDAIGDRERAREQLEAMQHLRDPDGSYWTGYVFADDARWPIECSSWTSAAVVLAVDALSCATPGSDIFRGASLPSGFTEIGLESKRHDRRLGTRQRTGRRPLRTRVRTRIQAEPRSRGPLSTARR